MSFAISNLTLTGSDPATAEPLKANLYTLEGVNNNQPMSIGMLVMALCLSRATILENGDPDDPSQTSIIGLMKQMEDTSDDIELLTSVHEKLVGTKTGSYTSDELDALDRHGITSVTVDNVTSALDSLNSFSQETMIELQSLTNKRDQAYDMAANILKSLNTVLTGIANNL